MGTPVFLRNPRKVWTALEFLLPEEEFHSVKIYAGRRRTSAALLSPRSRQTHRHHHDQVCSECFRLIGPYRLGSGARSVEQEDRTDQG